MSSQLELFRLNFQTESLKAQRLFERFPTKHDPHSSQPIGELERQAYHLQLTQVVGIDEAGRGPWAGPVVAAAVLFPCAETLPQALHLLNDSKQLKEQQRRALLRPIYEHALAIGVGHSSAQFIDQINILQATFAAMRQAIQMLIRRLSQQGYPLDHEAVLMIDGKQTIVMPSEYHALTQFKQHPLIAGDARSWSIAAASVIAKEVRDQRMRAYARRYPEYGFERHKGYGTALHQDALRQYGPCPIHRMSYKPIKQLIGSKENPTIR